MYHRRPAYRPGNEWAEARQEKIDDFRRFNANEAAIENERFERESAEEARKARLAANAEKIAKIERGES